MTRIRGPYVCDSCGQVSSLGWLYACTQDSTTHARPGHSLLSVMPGELPEDSARRFRLLALGISTSIITQYQRGTYTEEQMGLVVDQKKKVERMISEANHPQCTAQPSLALSPIPATSQPRRLSLAEQHSMAVPHRIDHDDIERSPANSREPSSDTGVSIEQCNYRCCHHCRPFLRDRAYASIEAIWNGEESVLLPEDTDELPILDADILSGLTHEPSTYEPYLTCTPLDTHMEQDSIYSHDLADVLPDGFPQISDILSSDEDSFPSGATASCPAMRPSPAATTISSVSSSSSMPATPSLMISSYSHEGVTDDEEDLLINAWHFLGRRRFSAPVSPTRQGPTLNMQNRPRSGKMYVSPTVAAVSADLSSSEEVEVNSGLTLTEKTDGTGLSGVMTQT